ncbi:hypothetical protein K469DRAFT_704480 [Zopfia rhizophila CBS 207.26]|uniref:Uncharacterized protein n=1 Tax=Zopfia rhizophila CBS 207.26 TaxID=1314779 RepID=A0A6A6EAM6_9PEZI|nr:hypothetical protein K469DRAFT_704480 [Zopfia rhizophila CBS 207.26]
MHRAPRQSPLALEKYVDLGSRFCAGVICDSRIELGRHAFGHSDAGCSGLDSDFCCGFMERGWER